MGVIIQTQPMSALCSSQESDVFSVPMAVVGNEGPVLFETTATDPTADLDCSQSGLITASGILQAGTYTAEGSLSDNFGNVGNWSFTLTVVGPYTPQTVPVPVTAAEPTGIEIAIPFHFDPATGALAIISDYYDIIEQHVRVIIQTGLGERVMLPNFGGNIDALLFSPIGSIAGVQASDLSKMIQQYEPAAQVTNVSILPLPGNNSGLSVSVTYQVAPYNDPNTVTVTTGGGIGQIN